MEYLPDLIEESLKLLDKEGRVDDETFRRVAAALYALEDRYHHTSTQFRLRALLVRRGYLVEVPLEDHPRASEIKEAIDDERSRDPGAPTPLMEQPGEPWDAEENPVAGYLVDEELIVEAGSALWQQLVEAGAVTDPVEIPEKEETFTQTVRAVDQVTEVASDAGANDLLLGWYSALGFHLTRDAGAEGLDDASELTDNEYLQQIKRRVFEIDDLSLKLADPRSDYDLPPRELREMHPFLSWWYD